MSTSSLASCASDGTANVSTGSSSFTSGSKEVHFDKCPRCRVQFDFLKRTNNVSSKVPLILNCKHTICEDCIRKMAIMNVSLCPVCREKFTVPKNQLDTITELFTPHFALIGYLLWTKNSPNKGNINWVSTGLTLKSKRNLGIDSMDIHSLPDLDKSDDNCEDEEVEGSLLSLAFDKCREHSDSSMNIHCEDCDKTVCCYCFVEFHGGHTPVYLYKLSDVEVSGLQQLKTEMETVLKQLLHSQMKVKQLKNFDLSNVENNIRTTFFNLHAKLHLAEQNQRKSLQDFKVDEADLDVVTTTLKSGVHRVSHVLNLLNTVSTKQINIRALYEEVQELKTIPCCLVSDQTTLDPIEFTVSPDIFEDLENNFALRKSSSIEYNLLPIEDWTNFREEKSVSSIKTEENPVPETKKRKSEGLESSAPPVHKEKKTYVKKGGPTHKVGRIRVVLTHINDLNSFYVQKLSVLNNIKSINKYLTTRPRRRLNPEDIKEGRIYGVFYETKHSSNWRRGKLTSIIPKGPNDFIYSIFFIDYGNTCHVTLDKLKEMDIHIVRTPPYAIHCKLTNPDHKEYDPKAHLRLPNIIGQRELYLQFMRKQVEGVQEVDLLIPGSTGSILSIRNFLSNAVPAPSEVTVVPENIKYFKNSKKFVPGQEDLVKVTYVQDPFNIYVQVAQNIDVVEKMKKEMMNFYEHHRHVACVPIAHTDVVVRFEDQYQGNWHRARITSVDRENEKVNAFCIDWGKSITVPWSAVNLLFSQDFTKIECQAISVKLADIQPENGDEEWPQKAIDFLNEQVLINNTLKMIVSEVDPLKVALFQIRPSADICLNALMVEQNLAISTGDFSQTLYWPSSQEVKMEEDDDDDGLVFQLIKKAEEVLVEDDDIELKHGLRQQVDVIRFDNPDLIYLKLAKYKELEEEMHKELSIHYNAERTTKKSWKPSEYCVIYDSARKEYFRGVIKAANGPESYQVYLYDHARELRVSKQFIFVQNLYFKRFLCYVLKCRLSYIKPAGDKGEWSQLAIEMLQKIFSTYKIIHIKKVETNRDQKMIGVRMWYSLTKPAKALEPAKMNFISVNKTLIESGVAFSTSTVTTVSESSETEDDKDSTDVADNSSKNEHKDWYEMICEEELLQSSTTSWPKTMPLQNREFEAILTCVDSEGIFSVRDDEMHSVYLDLEKNLNKKFNSLKLPQNGNVEWKSAEMCTIWYENSWYRGTVIEVLDSDEISVEMIDYGSEHVVSSNHIYKQIMFPDMPPLINKIKLFDVYSKYGQWTASDVDELLKIVTDRVKVVIKGDKNLEVPFGEVYLPSGLSVNDLVIKKCPHLYRCENKVILIPSDDDEDKCKDKSSDETATDTDALDLHRREKQVIPDEDKDKDESCDEERRHEDEFVEPEESCDATYTYVPITEGSKMLVVNVLKWGSEYKAVLKALNDNREDLEFLHTEIERCIDGQPLIEEFVVNEPCAAFHVAKSRWARALIYEMDNLALNFVSVFFVDYGTVDMISIDNLKVMKPEWFNFPVYNRLAIISVELVHSNKAERVLTQLNNLCGKSVKVKILQKDPLRVHLFQGKTVCYQNLISCGLLRPLS